MKLILPVILLACCLVSAHGQTRVSSFAVPLMGGSLDLLQVTGSVAGDTPGGPASAAARTIYFWTPDLSRSPPMAPGYNGANWPYVFVDRSLTIDPALNARLFGTIPVSGSGGAVIGHALTVNGAPVYQRTVHTMAGETAGIGANWQVITADGRGLVALPTRAQTRISTFVATTAEGSLEVLQVTGAVAGNTAGGPATAATRTLFYWTPDLARTPPMTPGYTGANWPLVFVDGSYALAPSLRPQLFGTVAVRDVAGNLIGEALTVNGYPVYQRTAHTLAGDIVGIGVNWQMIGTDGRGYTQMPNRATALAGLANTSSRALVGAGDATLITGFVIAPGSSRAVLVRAVGPGLAPFGVAGTLPQPALRLYSGSTVVGQNTNWTTAVDREAIAIAGVRVGAFGLANNDSALIVTLPPGAYTATVTGVGVASGVALVEVYELP